MLARELDISRGFLIHSVKGRGYVLFRDAPLRDILRLGVEEKARGQGLGEVLLLTALLGAKDAMLTVKKSNVPALRLYLKHGFQIVGELPLHSNWMMRRITSVERNSSPCTTSSEERLDPMHL